jgi:transcriptional regulator with XRE-family HTH domain
VSKAIVRDEICAEVVRLLVEERKRRRISGNSLAERAGLSQSLISSLETNPWNPTLDTLLRIGDVLEVDVGEIITAARKNILERHAG